jgi:hypothetical protein
LKQSQQPRNWAGFRLKKRARDQLADVCRAALSERHCPKTEMSKQLNTDQELRVPAMAEESLQPQPSATAAAGGDCDRLTSQPHVSRSSSRTQMTSPRILTKREEEVDICRGDEDWTA